MADLPDAANQTGMTSLDDEGFEASIRRVQHEGRWFFSVVDVVGVLTGSKAPLQYWRDMKRRLNDEGWIETQAKCLPLKMRAADGKQRLTDAADTETLLRIIQSVPSPKAEPIKQWLAQVGAERLREMEDPSQAIERARKDYERLGYAADWIERRLQGQVIRNELTQEWSDRGASESRDFARLTDLIHRGTFDLSVGEHKQVKGIRSQANLRDHETVLELLLTGISEETAKELHQARDSQGTADLQRDAREAGEVGGATRRDIESRLGRSVVSLENAKTLRQGRQRELQAPLLNAPEDHAGDA
ncbi:MAG TPA: Bro-N domain-containing protein [Ktedonobacterales bacterium]|nr:Bro-N domain-containing protein [Ktedonobacterales bacterium]